MIKTIIKRDDTRVDYNPAKIEKALKAALKASKEDITEENFKKLFEWILKQLPQKDEVTVEEVSDIVENGLMNKNYYAAARASVLYREERNKARLIKMKHMQEIKEKLDASKVANQNANVDEYSFGGRKGEADSVQMKMMALDYYMNPKFAKNHNLNRVYIHDLDAYVVGMHNCLERKTKFITSQGIRSFKHFNDGEEVEVLDKDGNWRKATVHCYSKHALIQDITFTRCGKEVTVGATQNHRWILKDESVTEDIKVGDELCLLQPMKIDLPIESSEDANWWALGFAIGDGWDHGEYTEVRLCGKKGKYKAIFEKAHYSVKSNAGEDITFCKMLPVGKQAFLDNKLWKLLPLKAKQLLFEGYYSADGGTTSNGCGTSDERIAEFIEDLSALCGYHIFSKTYKVRDTNYKKGSHIWTFAFTSSHSANSAWKVKSIQKRSHHNDSAWCIEEPMTHSFTLANGIVTGNCLSIPFDKLLKEGFGTRQTDIRPVNSVGTAFQILAVLFQVQSLQQFGGVSATHLDWTMVPYVRKSFYKHYKTGLKYIDEMSDEGIEEYLKALCITDKEPPIASPLYQKNAKVYKYAMDMTKKELKQAVEGMYHNLNTLQSRSGNQLPFSSINYGTCTLLEGQMVTEALLKGSIAGVGKYNKTSIFPCGIFQYKKGVNDKPGTPNYYLYRLALESTARRLYPNYANVDWKNDGDTTDYDVKQAFLSSLDPTQQRTLYNACVSHPEYCEQYGFDIDEASKSVKPKTFIPEAMFSTMGCRTNNGFDINWYEVWKDEVETIANGYKVLEPAAMPSGHVRDGRGNIAPATIILPTLAMESKKKAEKAGHPEYVVEYFFDALDKALTDCRDELIERFNWIAAQDPRSAKFMYENHTMAGYRPSEGIRSALKHGTLAVGQIGMAECLQILVGCNHLDPRGMELAKKIEQLYKDRCAEWKEKYKLNFGVYYTPAENLCYTAMKKFQKKYGKIPNVSDRDYFTNSIHVPVWEEVSPFEKIDIEAELTGYSSAGCITYVELDSNAKNNIDALETIVNYAMDKDIPYFALNLPNITCNSCGTEVLGEGSEVCPDCGSDDLMELARITGYLSTSVKHFNPGKQAEEKDRYDHVKKMPQWKRQ